MKQSEIEMLKCLRRGKKLNISEIARQLKIPASTVRDRIKRVEEKYVVKRSSLIDYAKLGYLANAVLAIKVEPGQKIVFLNFLKSQDCINSIHHTNSGFNFLVEIVCRDALELIQWVANVKEDFGAEIVTYHILKAEEKERFVPN